ncbi:diiron oxygenase [Rhodococcus sp. HNM0569]|uniref:AurF N-oxygenase family protein n=1 Tax=Rhodococcus sp. HNM0569 TaxID=2716340 RepID=UPI00146CB7C5|nr:diiron oxygenase [Rhodococcus sp. HNM0569]NLU84733.1 diiron oxygenase [Rhodococcus sp. HNM0569]
MNTRGRAARSVGPPDGLAPLQAPPLPAHDPADPVENAVIRGLSRSWPRRAAVKKKEPDLDELFDPDRDDYPESLMPFRTHPRYDALDEERRARLRAWAWIAYNKSVVDIEQYVVNPGFGVITSDVFGLGPGDTTTIGVMQAMVDEQYHTLMHQNANALTRRRRGWSLPDAVLPHGRTVRAHDAAVAAAADPRAAALVRFAYATVAETSISAYLGLLTGDERLQPVNRSTVAVHRRDELCHGSLAGELLTMVFDSLGAAERDRLLDLLAVGVDEFTASDLETWTAIVRHEAVPGGDGMMRDVAEFAANAPVVQDCSAIGRLGASLGVGADLGGRLTADRTAGSGPGA